MCDEVVANHLLSEIPDLLWSLADLYAALEPTGELTLATAACLNLRLQDEASLVGETRSDLGRICLVQSESTLLNVYSVLAHDKLRLELVQIEESTLILSHHYWLLSHASSEHVFGEHRRYHIYLFIYLVLYKPHTLL
jgi:hypothetical protein